MVRGIPPAGVLRDPQGVITGFGFASASTKDQPLAEIFFAVRAQPNARLGGVWELPRLDQYVVVDKGFEGAENRQGWLRHYGAADLPAQAQCPSGMAQALEALGR